MASFVAGPVKRCILLGGGRILADMARACRDSGDEVLVITSPRHAEEIINDGKTFKQNCVQGNISCMVAEKIDAPEIRDAVGSMKDAIAVSIGAAWLFTDAVIRNLFRNKLINAHGTRLPRDRGGGSHSWQIMRGDRLGNCLLHVVDAGTDTGPVIAHEEFVYPSCCRLPQDYGEEYRRRTVSFLSRFLQSVRTGERSFPLLGQPEYLSTYNQRLHTPINGWINWQWDAGDIERFICAFDLPYQGASTRWNARVVRLRNAFLQRSDGFHHPYEAGIVFRKGAEWMLVAAVNGDLIVGDARDEQGNSLLSKIAPGDRFVTLQDDLAAARERVYYGAGGLKREH